MAIMTLSWQYGCLGDLIAEEAAQELDYKIIGKQEMNAMLAGATGQASKELETDNALPTAGEELEPRFFQRLHRQHSAYTNFLMAFMYRAAAQDRSIIKGYGAQMVLAQYPHVYCVRLKGSVDTRVALLQEHRQLDRRTAEQFVKKEDRSRVEFIQYIFKQEFTDTRQYDLVVDMKKLDLTAITRLITEAVHTLNTQQPLKEETCQTLIRLALEHQVQATVQRYMPTMKQFEVNADTEGLVTLVGRCANEDEKIHVEQHVRSVPDVRDVVNLLHIQ